MAKYACRSGVRTVSTTFFWGSTMGVAANATITSLIRSAPKDFLFRWGRFFFADCEAKWGVFTMDYGYTPNPEFGGVFVFERSSLFPPEILCGKVLI